MGRNPIETVMGAVVLVVAGVFLAFAYNTADLDEVSGYEVQAAFNKVGGLEQGADVRISGIKVGTVKRQSLDPQSYQAVIAMSILPSIELPADTVATIASDGLLGGKYVRLEPGHGQDILPPGSTIMQTRDFQSVEDLVGEIIFLATQEPTPGAAEPNQQLPAME